MDQGMKENESVRINFKILYLFILKFIRYYILSVLKTLFSQLDDSFSLGESLGGTTWYQGYLLCSNITM